MATATLLILSTPLAGAQLTAQWHDDSNDLAPELAVLFVSDPADGYRTAVFDQEASQLWISVRMPYDPTPSFDVRVDVDGVELTTVTHDAVENVPYPGILVVDWTAVAGDHTFTVTVDPDDQITEDDETNNVLEHQTYVFAAGEVPPDVDVQITGAPSAVEPGSSIYVTAAVSNLGGFATGPFRMHTYVSAGGSSWFDVPDLEPGETAEYGMWLTVADHARYDDLLTISTHADTYLTVPQTNLDNDQDHASVEVLKPDLTITDIRVGTGAFEGEDGWLEITVANEGRARWDEGLVLDVDVSRTTTEVGPNNTTEESTTYVEHAWEDFDHIPYPGGSRTYHVPWTVHGGDLTFDATVRMRSYVDDADPSNDAFSTNLTLRSDLAVVDIFGADRVALTGEGYYEVTVTNQGNLGVSHGDVHIHVDGEAIYSEEIHWMETGSTWTASIYWSPLETQTLPGEADLSAVTRVFDGSGDADGSNDRDVKQIEVNATPLGV